MKVITKILYISAALLSFQFALNIAPGFDLSIIRVIILSLLGAIVLKSFLKKDFFIPLNFQSVCLFLFLTVNIFSMFLGKNMEFSLRKVLFLGSILPLYFIVLDIYRNKSDKGFTEKIIKWMVWGGAISLLAGMIVFICQFVWDIDSVLNFYKKIGSFFWGDTFSRSVFDNQSFLVNAGGKDFLRMFSFFPDPHNFALFAGIICFLSLSVFLYQIETQTGKRKTIFYGAISLLSAVSVFLSFSRGAYLALFGGVFLTAILWIGKRKIDDETVLVKAEKIRHARFIYMLFVVVLLVIFISGPVKDRFVDIFSSSDGSNIGRIQIMKDGLDIFKKHLFFGVGIGNAPLYYNEDADYRSPINSHSTYLEIAIENGLVGLSVWLTMIFGTIFSCARYFKKEKDGSNKYLSLGLVGGLMFFSVHSFFEVFLYSPINLSALMILLALGSIVSAKNNEN